MTHQTSTTYRRLLSPAARVRRTRRTATPKSTERLWLFDLDNTLHDTSHKIFAQISVGMTAAIMESLDVDEATAHVLRQRYWARYGATMIGLVKHHGVDAHTFLRRSHTFELPQLIKARQGIGQRFEKLQGRKVLLTNAPLDYAKAVLKHLGILHLFDGFWSVEHMKIHGQYRPKPSIALMRHVLAYEGVPAHRTVLIEDTLANLKAARAVGIRTVHVHHPGTPFAHGRAGRPLYVDLKVNQVDDLLLSRRPLRGG